MIIRLRSRKVENLTSCKDCFAKYNCSGDCYVRVARQGSITDTSDNARCILNREFLKHSLLKDI